LVVARRGGCVLLGAKAGFWSCRKRMCWREPPAGGNWASFRHSITNHRYNVGVVEARVGRAPRGFEWMRERELDRIPLSTMARKALALWVRESPDRGH